MKNLILLLIATVALVGCGTLVPLGSDACHSLLDGSRAAELCDQLSSLVEGSEEPAPEVAPTE